MLYVAAGLAVMFGVLAFLGLGAIDQATQLVFQERLATAYTTAGILERDFARAARDGVEAARQTATDGPPNRADALLRHFNDTSPYVFFRVGGVWLVDASGHVIDAAGSPLPGLMGDASNLITGLASTPTLAYAVERSVGAQAGSVGFAAIAIRLASNGTAGAFAVVHTVSINGKADYDPQAYGASAASPETQSATGLTHYHLEVVDPGGIAILGIGSDEQPGEPSHHFSEIRTLVSRGAAAAMLHQPGPGDPFEQHVMAVVPLARSPFYVVLEQPVDVALALPHQLQERLLGTIALGFVAALVVAWVTTRHVVKPTEQLTAAAGRMAAGDLASPIDVRAEDEIGRLADSLEDMRGQLQAARQASERLQGELERRVADRTARLNQLLGQTIDAQEAERLRLAHELHDETAQTLAALAISLDRTRDQLGNASPGVREQVAVARATAARLIAETRRLILGLRPAALDDLGLLPAIRSYAESSLTPLGIRVDIGDAALPRLDSYIELAVFRIVQEALTNVARHAQARSASVTLAAEAGELVVTIADDGVGFDVDRDLGSASTSEARYGLLGMQERVRLLGGAIEIGSGPNAGTRIVVRVPLATEEA